MSSKICDLFLWGIFTHLHSDRQKPHVYRPPNPPTTPTPPTRHPPVRMIMLYQINDNLSFILCDFVTLNTIFLLKWLLHCKSQINTDKINTSGGKSGVGRGPKVKISRINKILRIQLGLYIRKPGKKSLTQKKLILIRGFAFEKNGPCSWENEVKISKKRKMAKNHFSRSDFGS